jgi:hypothetical protein
MLKTIARGISALFILTIIISQDSYSQTEIRTGGFVKTWFLSHHSQEPMLGSDRNSSVTGVRVRKARLTLQADINQTFSTVTWFDFTAPDNNLLDFYVNADFSDSFRLRAGQFIMPGQAYDSGRRLATQMSLYEWPVVTTTLSSAMGFNAFRDIGVMAHGDIGRLYYGVHASNGFGRYTHAATQIQSRSAGSGLYGGRADYRLFDEVTIGAHYSINRQNDVVISGSDPFDLDRTSYSFRLATDDFLIPGIYTETEWMKLNVRDDNYNVALDNNGLHQMHGFYSKIGYRLTASWNLHGRFDQMVQKPGQTGAEPAIQRDRINRYTAGATYFLRYEGDPYGRVLMNYSTSDRLPGEDRTHLFVVVLQLLFIQG